MEEFFLAIEVRNAERKLALDSSFEETCIRKNVVESGNPKASQ